MLNDKIKKYLDNLDKEANPLQSFHGEYKIAEEIKNILKKEGESYKPSDEDISEQIAFDFLAEYLVALISNPKGIEFEKPLMLERNRRSSTPCPLLKPHRGMLRAFHDLSR